MTDDVDDVHEPLLGRVIDGRFTIQSVLGRGGMGVVYRAHQSSLERSVALKVMTGVAPEREGEFQRRFFLEAATVAKLKHPNTITVFDYGSSALEEGRVFFMAMELLEGQTLSQTMAKGRALSPLRAINIALQICRSLREAHNAGVVHRDLKPGNVMLVKQDDGDDVENDFVKVLDFGLAKTSLMDGAAPIESFTTAGTFMGSPRYVAPEQIEGRAIDARADIYSLGCLMFRMISGRVPFDGTQAVEIMLKHLHEPVPSLDVSGLPLSLRRLVEGCLQKVAADRPASMDAVLLQLKLIRAELGGTGSGVMVMVDERDSLPLVTSERELRGMISEHPLLDIEDIDGVEIIEPVVDLAPPPLPILVNEDSTTRPTRVIGPRVEKPRGTSWAAVTAGVVVGIALCAALVTWRLGYLDVLVARWQAPAVAGGPYAKEVRVRIKTTPPGAAVLEMRDGHPKHLGVTPLTLHWTVEATPAQRALVLRREGYVDATATLLPPAATGHEPAWLDVAATLRKR